MTGIAIKDIKGALVESPTDLDFTPSYKMGYRSAITKQGSVRLNLNRERLLHILKDTYSDYQQHKIDKDKSGAEHMADSIISQLGEILEVVK